MIRALFAAGIFALALAIAPPPAAAQSAPLAYVVKEPRAPSAKPPLLVLLHGSGADEQDMIDLAADVPDNFLVASLRAPLPGANGGYRWYVNRQTADGFAATDAHLVSSRHAALATIDAIIKRHDAHPVQVVVAGFSQGGVMAYELVTMEPERFLGGAAFGGALFASQEKRIVPSKRLTQTPFFIGHGLKDKIVPFTYAEKAKTVLERHRVILTFRSYPDLGHGISNQEIADFRAWLEKTAGPGTQAPTP